uniref:DNA-directed RNA polymerase III subunit RPC5 n=1 Tax=Davidia involucrata TaxID=16924 RepID=A0A5B7AY01_DAVIN
MSDMDLDDLDGPSQAPTRTTRFAPKNSKLKPQPRPKPESLSSEPPQSPPQSQASDSIHVKKKEELDSQPPLVDSVAAKTENKPSLPSSAANDAVKMDETEGSEEPKADPMEEDSDEDQVVREIDVFFTPPDSKTQLYVLQYPLRPCWRPYELDERCEEVRVKPISKKVEVDLSVDVDSRNYDPDFNLESKMTKQTLSSSLKPTRATGYAVGVLMGNKLHLNPIHAVVQLRPSMEHLKSGGSKKINVTSNVEVTIKSEEPEGEKSLGPSKKQNKMPGILNEQNKDIEECWVPLKHHGSKSDLSTSYLKKMVAQETSPIQFSMSPYDYVNSLCPGLSSDVIKPKGPSIRSLLPLPLEEGYKIWFCEGPPVNRFDTLKYLAPKDSIEEVLAVLQKHAQLVQGLWVPKSSLLYEGGQGREALARDYILLLFRKNPLVSLDQVNISKILVKAMKDVLNVLAVERPSFKDWKFKETQDMSFIKRHPDIVKEQEQAWERVEKPIIDSIFGGGKNGPSLKNSSKPDMASRPGASKNSNKGAAKSSNGALSRMPMSHETREALPKALQKLFQSHKVCSFQQICQRLRDMAVSDSIRQKGFAREAIAAANGIDAPQEELLEIFSQVAINIHGVFVSKSSPDHPQHDELRKIVINLLIAEGPNAKLKKASIIEAARLQLKRDITPNEYQKVLNELCVSQGSAWVLKSGDGNPK